MNTEGQDHDVPLRSADPMNLSEAAELVAELDRIAVTLIGDGRPERLAPRIAGLDDDELDGHPWAAVVVAAALQADTGGTDPRIDQFLMAADDAFWRDADERGLGYVAFVRGSRALGRGNLIDAAAWWHQAREYLGDEGGPLNELALAHLGLAEYHYGHLGEALRVTEQALALARRRRNRRGEGLSLLYLAFFALWAGEFTRAETLFTTARTVYGEIPDPLERFESPLVEAGLAALRALRRQRMGAEALFDSALEASEALHTEWFTAIIRALRAELCASWNPARSIADAHTAIDFLEGVMRDEWWCRWARRALALADLHAGNLRAAHQGLTELLQDRLNPIERVWTLLPLAECRWRSGDTAAALDLLHQSAVLADDSGSRYLQARAVCLLAEVDAENRQAWRTRALTLMDRDPAYRVLLTSSTPLRVDAFGRGRIMLADKPAKFATRHAEAAVFILALAGTDGVNAETLAEHLWPNVASSVWPGRVRTLLWQIRRALGDEAWRLERDGPIVRLDLAGATFDVDDARHLARTVLQGLPVPTEDRARLLARLRQPLLTAYQYEEWLTEYTSELGALDTKLARADRRDQPA